jgi:hypothetical protein
MKRLNWVLAAAGTALSVAGVHAAQLPLTHVSSIDLSGQFNTGSGYGSNPLSVAFDGANAYVGGYNNSGATGNIGVVKVSSIFGGAASFAPMATTQFSSPNARGLDALAYASATGSLVLAHDSGGAATSFIKRYNAGSGALDWNVANPQASRPFAMAIDPTGNAGNPGIAFLTQGSGRRRLLAMDGTNVYDGTTGGILTGSPTNFGSAWRAMAFDSDGNIAMSEDTGFQYGVRSTVNQWTTIGGSPNLTSSSITKNAINNNVGQGVAIMEDLGADLLAVTGRAMTQFTDLAGSTSAVDPTDVLIRNLDGSTTTLTQLGLNGDEDGIGTPWTGQIKNLAFGEDGAGNPVLVVVDFTDRRMDVYTVPEPTMLGVLALAGLTALRRRNRN